MIPNFKAAEGQSTRTHEYAVKSGSANSITVGDVVIKDTSNTGYVKAKGTGEITSADTIVGVAVTTSTDTATANGVVVVADDLTNQVVKGRTVGTPAQAQVGTIVTITSGADGTQKVNEDNPTNGVAEIIDFDATRETVDFKFVQTPEEGGRLEVIQETVALADFTDGGSTAGTVELSTDIPVGAVVTRTLITDVTGFAGDTSAVVTIGDGTDVDRYNTGTPSVFATAANVDAGAVSGTIYHSAAKTPKITVTSATDFGAVTAGEMTVTIFYYTAG